MKHFEGMPVRSAFDVGSDRIILIAPEAHPRSAFRNLLRVDLDGLVIWRAALPSDPDVFLSVTLAAGSLRANTWSGFCLLLDATTGAELDRVFVK